MSVAVEAILKGVSESGLIDLEDMDREYPYHVERAAMPSAEASADRSL